MNTFGNIFRLTTWGESHGKAMGCVIDGCPAGLEISKDDIKKQLDRDVPIEIIATPRKEKNEFEILSGVFQGKTLGTPISIIIYNRDVKSEPYKISRNYFRPGHADYTYLKKYKYVDFRGGSRASGRECIARLAAGAIAQKLIKTKYNDLSIKASISELAGIKIKNEKDLNYALNKVQEIGLTGDSSGGKIDIIMKNLPAGIGNPVFGKLSAILTYAMSTIGGVKAVEIGEGVNVSYLKGSENNDGYEIKNNKIVSITNHSGGISGGISNGSDIVIKLSVKPTPTIFKKQHTVTKDGKEVIVQFEGRHDMNFTPRVCPIAENMAAIVIADFLLSSGCITSDSIYKKYLAEYEKEGVLI